MDPAPSPVSRPRLFTVPTRGAAASCQERADDLFRQCREDHAVPELSDEELASLAAILGQSVDELKELCD